MTDNYQRFTLLEAAASKTKDPHPAKDFKEKIIQVLADHHYNLQLTRDAG